MWQKLINERKELAKEKKANSSTWQSATWQSVSWNSASWNSASTSVIAKKQVNSILTTK